MVTKTGLLLDPLYRHETVLDPDKFEVRATAPPPANLLGTIDSFLIWRDWQGMSPTPQPSRTSLYNIYENDWDDELLALFDVPRTGLLQVMDCAAEFGSCDGELFGTALPIRGVAGDQQAAAIGRCFTPGALKSTYNRM